MGRFLSDGLQACWATGASSVELPVAVLDMQARPARAGRLVARRGMRARRSPARLPELAAPILQQIVSVVLYVKRLYKPFKKHGA